MGHLRVLQAVFFSLDVSCESFDLVLLDRPYSLNHIDEILVSPEYSLEFTLLPQTYFWEFSIIDILFRRSMSSSKLEGFALFHGVYISKITVMMTAGTASFIRPFINF